MLHIAKNLSRGYPDTDMCIEQILVLSSNHPCIVWYEDPMVMLRSQCIVKVCSLYIATLKSKILLLHHIDFIRQFSCDTNVIKGQLQNGRMFDPSWLYIKRLESQYYQQSQTIVYVSNISTLTRLTESNFNVGVYYSLVEINCLTSFL